MGAALLLFLVVVGCAVPAPRPKTVHGSAERVRGSLETQRPPARTARGRPPAVLLPPAATRLRADDGPLTAKITVDTPPGRAAALRLTEQARGLLKAGETERAIERLERAIAIDARVAYAYYFLAEAHYQADRPRLARSFLNRAEQMLVREPYWLSETRALRGLVSERQGRLAAARRAYRRALAIWPDNERAASGLARVIGQLEEGP